MMDSFTEMFDSVRWCGTDMVTQPSGQACPEFQRLVGRLVVHDDLKVQPVRASGVNFLADRPG